MNTKLDTKILIHWGLVLTACFFLLINIETRPNRTLIILGLLINTLLVNKYSYVRVRKKHIIVAQNILFFIPTLYCKFKYSEIEKIEINICNNNKHHNISEEIITAIFIGSYFYETRYKLQITLKNHKSFETKINLTAQTIESLKEKISII